MGYGVRVSKKAVADVLHKYLSKELANDIFWEICDQDEADQKAMIGMTYREWAERFDDDRKVLWADDTLAGFGKKGDTVYGNADSLVICSTEYDGKTYKLYVWSDVMSTEDPSIKAVMKEWRKKHDMG